MSAPGLYPAAPRRCAIRWASPLVAVPFRTATVTVAYDFPLLTGAFFPEAVVRLERTTAVRVAPRPGD